MRFSGADLLWNGISTGCFFSSDSSPIVWALALIYWIQQKEQEKLFSAGCPWWWIGPELVEKPPPAGILNLYMPTCSQPGLLYLFHFEITLATVLSFLWLSLWLYSQEIIILCQVKNLNLFKRWWWIAVRVKTWSQWHLSQQKVTSCFSLSTWSDGHLCADQAY